MPGAVSGAMSGAVSGAVSGAGLILFLRTLAALDPNGPRRRLLADLAAGALRRARGDPAPPDEPPPELLAEFAARAGVAVPAALAAEIGPISDPRSGPLAAWAPLAQEIFVAGGDPSALEPGAVRAFVLAALRAGPDSGSDDSADSGWSSDEDRDFEWDGDLADCVRPHYRPGGGSAPGTPGAPPEM